ncbi:hypothetical protein [Streptomyces canus]|uniref:hypothetical protein n=1 Tax=Streptomyces canus TaxID=58343 RepID=UPI0033A6701C
MNDGPTRLYGYAGPPELRSTVRPDSEGRIIRSPADHDAWLSGRGRAETTAPFTFVADLDAWLSGREPAETTAPFAFVADLDGPLRFAPRWSEHVACAGGTDVRAAIETGFTGAAGRWTAHDATNHSRGYCPDLDA